MMRITTLPLVFLLLGACESHDGLTGIDEPDGEGSDPEDIPWDEGTDGDEIWEEAYFYENCAGYTDPSTEEFYEIAGATRFFAGDYRVNEETGTVSGKEYWLLVANDRWKELGEDDCQVVWGIEGDVLEPECAACDYAISVHGAMLEGESNCPDGLQDLEREWDATYDIANLFDGSSEFRFFDSGNLFAEGWWVDDRVAWISDPACMFF